MRDFLQYVVSGLSIGSVYAILALGWVLVKQASNLLFFLQGEFVVLTVFVVASLVQGGAPLVVAGALAVSLCLVIALGVDQLVVRRLRNPTPFSEVVVLLGLALLAGQLIQRRFGPHPMAIKAFLPRNPVEVAGTYITPHQILAMVVMAVLALGLRLVMGRTMLGLSMRAAAGNPQGAVLVGVRPSQVRTLSILGAALLGGVAGIVLGPLMPLGPLSGLVLSLKGFIAAVLARWSFGAAVLAGAGLGLVETFAAGYISSVYKDVISLGLLIVALLLQATLVDGRGSRVPRLGIGSGGGGR